LPQSRILFFLPIDPHLIVNTEALGSIGMTLFFTLSGFVIHYNYGDALADFRIASIWSFAVARFARLYPLYLLAFALTLAFIPNPYAGDQLQQAFPFYITLTQDWYPLKINGNPLSSLYVGQAWSISAEIMLYFFYIPLARGIRSFRSPRAVLSAVALLLVVATAFNLGRANGYWAQYGWNQYYDFYQSPYCRFSEFLLGALVATLYRKRIDLPSSWLERKSLLYMSLGWIVVVFFGAYSRHGNRFIDFEYSWGYAPACAGMIYYFARNRGRLSWVVESWPVILLGDASYSLYMLSGWSLWMFSANGASPSYGVATYRMVMAWVFLILLSLGSFKYFEVPARQFIRRAAAGRRKKSTTKTEPQAVAETIEAS